MFFTYKTTNNFPPEKYQVVRQIYTLPQGLINKNTKLKLLSIYHNSTLSKFHSKPQGIKVTFKVSHYIMEANSYLIRLHKYGYIFIFLYFFLSSKFRTSLKCPVQEQKSSNFILTMIIYSKSIKHFLVTQMGPH